MGDSGNKLINYKVKRLLMKIHVLLVKSIKIKKSRPK